MTSEEVLCEVKNSTVFSKLDLKYVYWHTKFDEESSLMTTFQTPFGRYRCLRLTIWLKSSTREIFQMKMREAFENIPGLINIADDIVIHGKNEREHNKILSKFLERYKVKQTNKKL
ncbi:uncharacterized protein NPIL_243221 [Nephila pilipes]|uniref:Reverse transcriptase domain-containing protein n=1 Tax=Nephila pilipes TaxID=299642 RepID=A0A8X6Q4B4_NEPPI|nr:uncharacterized protein NPIL_243221 [Nephila pilipes]